MEKSAKKRIKVLLSVLDEYANMQEDHAYALCGNRLNTLPGWLERRQNVSSRLQQCLERFDYGVLPEKSLVARQIREKMNEIVRNEKGLATLVARQKDRIQGEISTLRRGKKVLKGYNSQGVGSRPKFLSSRK